MPPASLSTLEVISPGPDHRQQQRQAPPQRRGRACVDRCRDPVNALVPRSMARPVHACLNLSLSHADLAIDAIACTQTRDHVVHGDRADGTALRSTTPQAAQVVLVEQLEDFLLVRVGRHRNQRLGLQVSPSSCLRSQQQPRDRSPRPKTCVAVDQQQWCPAVRCSIPGRGSNPPLPRASPSSPTIDKLGVHHAARGSSLELSSAALRRASCPASRPARLPTFPPASPPARRPPCPAPSPR